MKRICLLSFGLIGLWAANAHAAVTVATLSNYTIPYETIGTPTGTTINFTIDTGGTVEISIDSLDGNPENHTGISRAGLAPGSFSVAWDALWPIGGTLGRRDGLYRVTVTQTGANTYVIGTPLEITSVDIHSVNVTTAFDANQDPILPYTINYALAKNSFVTLRVVDSTGTYVRTLLEHVSQFNETIKSNNAIVWNGRGDNNRPVPLGIYDVAIIAQDSSSPDQSIVRRVSVSVNSLASLDADAKELFETQTYVYPNPVRNGQATFHTLAVRNNATITLRIYTIAGDLVREERRDNLVTGNEITIPWNADNQSGKKVGRGLYYYVMREQDEQGALQTVKKMAVIP